MTIQRDSGGHRVDNIHIGNLNCLIHSIIGDHFLGSWYRSMDRTFDDGALDRMVERF